MYTKFSRDATAVWTAVGHCPLVFFSTPPKIISFPRWHPQSHPPSRCRDWHSTWRLMGSELYMWVQVPTWPSWVLYSLLHTWHLIPFLCWSLMLVRALQLSFYLRFYFWMRRVHWVWQVEIHHSSIWAFYQPQQERNVSKTYTNETPIHTNFPENGACGSRLQILTLASWTLF